MSYAGNLDFYLDKSPITKFISKENSGIGPNLKVHSSAQPPGTWTGSQSIEPRGHYYYSLIIWLTLSYVSMDTILAMAPFALIKLNSIRKNLGQPYLTESREGGPMHWHQTCTDLF